MNGGRTGNGTSHDMQNSISYLLVPVQFQYSAHGTRDRNSFQDHHTLHSGNDSYDSKAGGFSTCTHTPSAKYFTEWTSSTLCRCPQATESSSQTLRKVQHLHNGRTSVNRLPLMKQNILSHYSGCFEGIGCFPGEPYKFHLKPEHKPARHSPRKVLIHLEDAFKEEIKSLVKLGILEEVREHTAWVNSCVIVEKDSGNHHSANHTIKRELRIYLDPRDLNEALERECYHTCSVDK